MEEHSPVMSVSSLLWYGVCFLKSRVDQAASEAVCECNVYAKT